MIEDTQLEFRTVDIDFNSYFESLIGVTIPENNPGVETIRLHISAGRAPYVLTKKIHSTQQKITDTSEGVEIELRLIINQELKTLLLGFGPDLKALAPVALRKSMKKLLKNAFQQYE